MKWDTTNILFWYRLFGSNNFCWERFKKWLHQPQPHPSQKGHFPQYPSNASPWGSMSLNESFNSKFGQTCKTISKSWILYDGFDSAQNMQLSWRKLDAFKCKKARVIKSLFCKCLGERWKDICKRFYKCPKDQSAPSFHLFTFWVKKSMNSKIFFRFRSHSNHLTCFFQVSEILSIISQMVSKSFL